MRSTADTLTTLMQMSGSATGNTSALHLLHTQGYSIQANVVAGASGVTGSFKLQASNDPKSQNLANPQADLANWVDIGGSTQAVNVSAAASGSFMWNVAGAYCDWVRLTYVNTANSGSFSARAVKKGPQ